jgi:hypothetical protein
MYAIGQSLRMIHTDHSTTPLTVGKVYVISDVKLYSEDKPLYTIDGLHFNFKEMSIYFALDKPKTKRPLPEWF